VKGKVVYQTWSSIERVLVDPANDRFSVDLTGAIWRGPNKG